MSKKTCPSCGAENANNVDFCKECQTFLIGEYVPEGITTYESLDATAFVASANSNEYNPDDFEDLEVPEEIETEDEDDTTDEDEEQNPTCTSLTTTYVEEVESPTAEREYEDIAHDDEFMDSIAETPKKKLNPEQTKQRREALDVRNGEIDGSLIKHRKVAELLNHQGLQVLISDLENGCITDVKEHEIKEATKSLKALDAVLTVKSLLKSRNVLISQLENELASNERELQNLGAYQTSLFDNLAAPKEVIGEVVEQEILQDEQKMEEKPLRYEKPEWQSYADSIEIMLDEKEYAFASETLESILDWITEKEHITDDQITAIKNIQNSAAAA